jgi:hypothetical protein
MKLFCCFSGGTEIGDGLFCMKLFSCFSVESEVAASRCRGVDASYRERGPFVCLGATAGACSGAISPTLRAAICSPLLSISESEIGASGRRFFKPFVVLGVAIGVRELCVWCVGCGVLAKGSIVPWRCFGAAFSLRGPKA